MFRFIPKLSPENLKGIQFRLTLVASLNERIEASQHFAELALMGQIQTSNFTLWR